MDYMTEPEISDDTPVVMTMRLVNSIFERLSALEQVIAEIIIQAGALNLIENTENMLNETEGE